AGFHTGLMSPTILNADGQRPSIAVHAGAQQARATRYPCARPTVATLSREQCGAAFLQLQGIVGNQVMARLIDTVQRTCGPKSGCSCSDCAVAEEPPIGRLFRPDSRALARLLPHVMRQEAPVALLRHGSRGTAVRDLQQRLNKVGAIPRVDPD